MTVVDTPGQQDAVVEPEPPSPEGAVSGEAVPYPNIHLVTLGYNLFYGDPLPLLPENADPKKLLMDPGLRKPLFKLSYDDNRLTGDRRHTQPDGYHATVDLGCSTSFSTKQIRDLSQYQTEQAQISSIGARAEVALVFPPVSAGKGKAPKKSSKLPKPGIKAKAFARVGGTMSYQTKDIQSSQRLRTSTMYSSNAKCSSYVVGLSFAKPPQTHPDFQAAVDGLNDAPSAYYSLFDNFGTHMLTTVKMGGRSAANMFIDNTKANEVRSTANGFGVSLEASVGAVAKVSLTPSKGHAVGGKVAKKKEAKVNVLTPNLVSAAKDVGRLLQRKTRSIVGPPMPAEGVDAWQDDVVARPVPMAFDSQPICEHPAITEDADTYEKCEMFMETYCDEHLKPLGGSCSASLPKECYTDLDCEDGHVCREFDCVKVPECEVTVFKDSSFRNFHYTFVKVNNLEHFGGKLVDLKNADWWDEVSSIKLSNGCSRIEAIDDDGSCVLGKSDNRVYGRPGAGSLPDDLDNDVCKMKVYARKVPKSGPPKGDLPGWIDTSDCSTSQSSTNANGYSPRAADGDHDGNYGAGSCTHTGRDRHPWWEMDMKTSYVVNVVKIANRGDCCGERLNPFDITVDGKTCARSQSLPTGAYEEVQCDNPPVGRKIKIQVLKDTYLTLCEVEVYGQLAYPEGPQWLTSSDFSASQSSTARSDSASKARDGDSNGAFHAGSCTHTKTDNSPWWQLNYPWWQLDMKDNYAVTKVKIANRADCCGDRLNPFDVTVDGKVCAKSRTLRNNVEEVLCDNQDNPPVGRKLKIQVKKRGEFSLCEVEVYGKRSSRRLQPKTEEVFNDSSTPEIIIMSEKDVLYAESVEVPGAPTRKLSDYDSYLPNIGKSNYGYNHWIAAPASAEYAGSDPGFARRPIFATSYDRGATAQVKAMNDLPYMSGKASGRRLYGNKTSVPELRGRRVASTELKAPDGWKVTKAERTVCEAEYSTRELKSGYEYEAEMTDTTNPLFGRIDIGSFSFAYSSEESEFSQANAKFKKSMSKTGAECFNYQVEMDKANPPATSENFKYVVDAVNAEHEYYRLFDLYGLQYATHMNFGARYGLTQTITEKSYRTLFETSSKEKMSVEYTIGIPKVAKKTGLAGGITLSASHETKKTEREVNEQSEFFKDRKEFSIGKRVPAEGGGEAWADAADGEPMPVRYTLVSICEHPEFVQSGKKHDCQKYQATYCTKHLTKMKEDVSCDPPQKKECLWDMDCEKNSECSSGGKCVPLPQCYVQWGNTKLGPVLHRDAPMGKTYGTLGKKIDIVTVSGGCAEVVFVDEDNCKEIHSHNIVAELRNSNVDGKVDLPYDLTNDVCKIKLIPKKQWA
eukprot:TRINITY_DN2219_c0_g1_i2.p1 TRINITY_DN2219_c0_g1~~TRINITY_DN2219_c0_g1_i2.p1  ORF type:complete len:1500 (-),score=216.34 TRINITY_DN2219_c0_g1_i2:137-4207(-)